MPSQDFYGTYAPLANDIATQTGMDPSVVLGIIDTETGAGQHVQGNNIFGISPGGRVANYPDVSSAGQAFVDLINKRYPGVASAGTVDGQAAALVRGGYNTANPQYAATVAAKARQAQQVLGYQDEDQGQGADTAVAAAPAQPAQPAKSELDTAVESVKNPPAAPGSSAAAPATPAAPATGGQGQSELDKAIQTIGPVAKKPADSEVGPSYSVGPDETTGTSDAVNKATTAESDSIAGARGLIQKGDIAAQNWLAQHLGTGTLGKVAAMGPHLLAGLADIPLSVAQGVTEGPVVTLTPGGTLGTTPEAITAATVLGGGGLRFSGDHPLAPVTPGTFDRTQSPPLTGVQPLSPEAAARGNVRAATREGPAEPAPSTPTPEAYTAPPQGAGTQPQGATTGGPAPGGGTWRPVGPDEVFPPGRQFRMNQTTGVSEVYEPGAGPGAAGAQRTPPLTAGMSPEELRIAQTTDEGRRLTEGQPIGERDDTTYVKGVTANAAEQEQTAAMARELKGLGITNPAVDDAIRQAKQDNNIARIEHFRDTAGSPGDYSLEERARENDINTDKVKVFAPDNVKGDVNHAPIVKEIDDTLNAKVNKQNDAVQSVLRMVRDRLVNEDGTPKIVDPEEMWGLRQQVDRWTSERMGREQSNFHYAAKQLNNVAKVMDQEIDKVAPGYAKMKNTYAEHTRKMEEMKVLQDLEPQILRGPNATMTFNDVHRAMRTIVKNRNTPSWDLNPYKSISPEKMDQMFALHSDLRRAASAIELARAAGSDTVPNFVDIFKQYAKLGGRAGAHAVANAIAPGVGSVALESFLAAARPYQAARMARKQVRRAGEILRPAQGPNPLEQGPYP